ncbi:MAG: EamA family transporter RarD [Eubacteriales bacterium]|nr:EamA family transporter RarD [Eubacteriales bacterium]
MNRKSLVCLFISYVLWGCQSLYWALLSELDSMFILACRIIWAALLLVLLLMLQRRIPELTAVFKNRQTMRYLVPATLFLLVDWGVFIWAVQAGHVLDVSMGYYMMPLVVFLTGIVLFRERCSIWQFIAIGLAAAGVFFSIFRYGNFPLVSVVLSIAFAVYAALKKYAKVEPVVSIAAESLMLSPLALIYILLFGMGQGAMGSVNVGNQLLLILSGVVTALPMILYAEGVNNLPFYVLAICQYISPTIGIFCGLFLGEQLTEDKLVTFLFIWVALIIFTVATAMQEKKLKAKKESAASEEQS